MQVDQVFGLIKANSSFPDRIIYELDQCVYISRNLGVRLDNKTCSFFKIDSEKGRIHFVSFLLLQWWNLTYFYVVFRKFT